MSGAARLLLLALPVVIAAGAWALLQSETPEDLVLDQTSTLERPRMRSRAPGLSTKTREKSDALLAGRAPPKQAKAITAAKVLDKQGDAAANERERLAIEFDDLVLRAARWGTLRTDDGASALEHRVRASAEIVGKFPPGAQRAAVARHVRRFAIGVRGQPETSTSISSGHGHGRGRPNVDALIESVAGLPGSGVTVEPLPQDDAEEAEKRRLEELDRLRNAGALDLLDHVAGALAWLALHQAPDGSFSDLAALQLLKERARDAGADEAAAGKGLMSAQRYELSTTALATLAFLDFRDQDLRGLFEATLARGIAWLLRQQLPNGGFTVKSGRSFYSQAIALMALGQAAETTGRKDIKDAVRRGLAWLHTQVGEDGGYRYVSKQPGDLSASGWVAQAIETASWAGVEVPEGMRDDLRRFIRGTWLEGAKFGYLVGQRGRSSLYPVGMLSMTILAPDEVSVEDKKAWALQLKRWPREKRLYQRYYHVRMAVKLEGKLSKTLGAQLMQHAKMQRIEGDLAGAFDRPANYMSQAGVTGRTAMTTLMFEHALYVR